MNQEDLVLDFMIRECGITSMQAFKALGVTRLSAKIFELRKKYDIRDVWEESVNRYGVKTRYKRYIFFGKLGK